MKTTVVRNIETGEYLGPGEDGDALPRWTDDIGQAWSTRSPSVYFRTVGALAKMNYRVEGKRIIDDE